MSVKIHNLLSEQLKQLEKNHENNIVNFYNNKRENAKAFFLSQTPRTNIIDNATLLKEDSSNIVDGCEYMPSINSSGVTNILFNLIKNKRKAFGIARVTLNSDKKYKKWSIGTDSRIIRHLGRLGMKIITISPKVIVCEYCNWPSFKIIKEKVEIV